MPLIHVCEHFENMNDDTWRHYAQAFRNGPAMWRNVVNIDESLLHFAHFIHQKTTNNNCACRYYNPQTSKGEENIIVRQCDIELIATLVYSEFDVLLDEREARRLCYAVVCEC